MKIYVILHIKNVDYGDITNIFYVGTDEVKARKQYFSHTKHSFQKHGEWTEVQVWIDGEVTNETF